MDIINEIEKYVKEASNSYKINSEDNYDFWNEHIKYVYKESIILAKKYNADIEIVSLGALLHDIALIKKVGDKKEHHINGKILSKQILEGFNYDKDKLDRVLKCVYNHRSSKNSTSIEELCVADADVLAHFDNIPLLFNSGLVRSKIGLNDINNWMKNVLEKDYNDLSDKTKLLYKRRYNNICETIIKK